MKSITRFTKNLHGKKCLNCERELSVEDNFCPRCGQVNDMNRLSVKQYFSEYLSGFFEFDNRFLRTVIPLLIKPGTVSKNYVNGRRIYYANPFQLYLHITILFFLLVGVFKTIDSFKPGAQSNPNLPGIMNSGNREEVLDSIKRETLSELQNSEVEIDSATLSAIDLGVKQIAAGSKKPDSARLPSTEKRIQVIQLADSLLANESWLETLVSAESSQKEKDSVAGILMGRIDMRTTSIANPNGEAVISELSQIAEQWENYSEKSELNREGAARIEEVLQERGSSYKIPVRLVNPDDVKLPDNSLGRVVKKVRLFMDYDKSHPDAEVLAALSDLGIKPSYWNVFYFNKARDWNEALSDANYWQAWKDRVLSRVSVALFFLLPIFTLIVSLLYIRHRYNYTENLVFVFHVQTVFFLLLMIFMILGRFSDSEWVNGIFIALFLFYLYKAMRNFYEQGRFKTMVKFILLNTSFMILAAIGAVIVSFLAFLI